MQSKLAVIDVIFEATAIQQSVDMQYALMSSHMPGQYLEKVEDARMLFPEVLSKLNEDVDLQKFLFLQYFLYGNVIELESELQRQLNDQEIRKSGATLYGTWQSIVTAITKIKQSEVIHLLRQKYLFFDYMINLQQSGIDGNVLREQIENEIFSHLPSNFADMRPRLLIIPFLSRIPPTASDIFFATHRYHLENISDPELAVFNQATRQFGVTLRTNMNRIANPSSGEAQLPKQYLDSYSLLLESKVAATRNDQQRISNVIALAKDKELLINFSINMQMYCNGIVPGAITPSKVYASNDIRSDKFITNCITYLATTQIPNGTDGISNPNIAKKMQEMAVRAVNSGSFFTAPIETQINQSKFVERNKANLDSTKFTTIEDQNIINQGSGPLTLAAQLNSQQNHQEIVTLNEMQDELLRVQISIAIACIRIRFDATSQTDYELVSQGDISVLYVCMKLAKYVTDPASLRFFKEIGQGLIEMILNFNETRLLKLSTGVDLDGLHRAKAIAEEQLGPQLMQIKLLSDDNMQNRGELYQNAIEAMYISLCQQNRESLEIDQRRKRRTLLINAINSIQ